MSPKGVEAGQYRQRAKKVNACRVKAIIKQPGLGIEKKTQLPEWVRNLATKQLIRVVREPGKYTLAVAVSDSPVPIQATGTAWLLQNVDDESDLMVLEDATFKERYHDGPTDRERELEERLEGAHKRAKGAEEEADRLYPGEPPGRDSMG